MTNASTHGYSGKPLAKKLGIAGGMRCRLIGAPEGYLEYLAPPSDAVFTDDEGGLDFVQLFCRTRQDLEDHGRQALTMLAPRGMLWVSWPKKSSGQFVDLTEDGVREVLLPEGWVDVKVCAVDATWSGLKFLERRT